jgi:3-oxoacyl-[acyl-carrier-protein] synthase-3
MSVYINDVSAFLPNDPVDNEEIEEVLGKINNISSRTKRIILRNNKINFRHYAIDKTTKALTHTNAKLAAEAIKRLKPTSDFELDQAELLCCGTSSPDLLLPGHGVMVHGELNNPPCEVVSTAGICTSGITALKYAYMSVASGTSSNAIAAGSELASGSFRSSFFDHNISDDKSFEDNPELAFDIDFLRWMLSDGSGAMYLSDKKNEQGISLKIEWIDLLSHAGSMDTCMYAGGIKQDNGSVKSYRSFESFGDSAQLNAFALRQDVKQLNENIVDVIVDKTLLPIAEKHKIKAEDIDWFLPHFSSGYFRDKIYNRMKEVGFEIPYEKWFTNLYTKGNTGSAAIYIILEELYKSGKLNKGDKLLLMVPESGRFSTAYALLTVV